MASLGTALHPGWQTPILHAADGPWRTDGERKRVGKDGSIEKVFAKQSGGPEFGFPTPIKSQT